MAVRRNVDFLRCHAAYDRASTMSSASRSNAFAVVHHPPAATTLSSTDRAPQPTSIWAKSRRFRWPLVADFGHQLVAGKRGPFLKRLEADGHGLGTLAEACSDEGPGDLRDPGNENSPNPHEASIVRQPEYFRRNTKTDCKDFEGQTTVGSTVWSLAAIAWAVPPQTGLRCGELRHCSSPEARALSTRGRESGEVRRTCTEGETT